jgi:hypothetical protein
LVALANEYRNLESIGKLSRYIQEVTKLLVEPFATEVLGCAEDLFEALPNPTGAPFPIENNNEPDRDFIGILLPGQSSP